MLILGDIEDREREKRAKWFFVVVFQGMAVQATDQHIEVFMDAVLYLQTSVDILDIVKTDENGENGEPGTIVDLFPVGSAAHGRYFSLPLS